VCVCVCVCTCMHERERDKYKFIQAPENNIPYKHAAWIELKIDKKSYPGQKIYLWNLRLIPPRVYTAYLHVNTMILSG
jgi:hypothetical protein